MQNNKFLNFLKEKGYYIVLLVCAAAVGVTGYFILRGDPDEEPAVPAVASVAPSTQTSESTEGESSRQTESTEPDESDAPTAQTEPFSLTAPVDGETVTAFAADHLAYNATTRDWRTHEGIDLGATLGQKVLAAADGTVYAIYDDENYGTTVVLRHSDGFTTHYANLSEEVSVTVGQTVARGTCLGTVGQTANAETATAPHLHFALFRENTPVDPSEFWGE